MKNVQWLLSLRPIDVTDAVMAATLRAVIVVGIVVDASDENRDVVAQHEI
jgi:hypothetical protein